MGEYEAYGEEEGGHETGPRDQGQVVLRLARLQVRQSTAVIALIRVGNRNRNDNQLEKPINLFNTFHGSYENCMNKIKW